MQNVCQRFFWFFMVYCVIFFKKCDKITKIFKLFKNTGTLNAVTN